MHSSADASPPTRKKNWQEIVAPYQQPKLSQSLWQVVNTFVPYVILLYIMYLTLGTSYWLTLLRRLNWGARVLVMPGPMMQP